MTPALLDAKAEPLGSLGRLEALAVQLATIPGTLVPMTRVFANVAGPVPDSVINQWIVPGTAGWRHGSVNYSR